MLAVVFNILSNLISDTSKKAAEATALFKSKYCKFAIQEAIAIMIKNQERLVDDSIEEENEKCFLSLSVLNFFKHISKEIKTKDLLCHKAEILKRFLHAEQTYTYDHSFVLTPIEIEIT